MALQHPSLSSSLQIYSLIPNTSLTSQQPCLTFSSPAIFPSLKTSPTLCRTSAKDKTSFTSVIPDLDSENTSENSYERPVQHGELPDEHLADRWREFHGRDDWAGLLDPMDPVLRSELIRYGEFAQASYDAFDCDPFSRYCGSSKYPRRSFFARLGLDAAGYERPRAWSERACWVGYVAVSGDEATARLGRRDIVVAWRGTVTKLEWVADLMDFLRPVAEKGIPCPDRAVKAESGFMDYYTDKDATCRFCKYSAREQVLTEVKRLVELYTKSGEEVSITVTGHSLGSALAMLSAYDMAETGVNMGVDGKRLSTCVISFSGPRVGNVRFKERFEEVGIKALRVVNVHDSVPKVPGIFFNEHVPEFVRKFAEGLPWSYCHVGVELVLDHKLSPFLKDTSDPASFHNLEALLHLLDGYHGRGERFVLSTGRDPALVNKACDFLKDHHMVPPHWRQDENKGMIRASDGRWIQAERPKFDDHPKDIPQHLRQLGLDR